MNTSENEWNLPIGKEPHRSRYLRFIRERLVREPREKNTERHHILPRALGAPKGVAEPTNIVFLSTREHFIAHLILWKCYGRKMTAAFWYMTQTKKGKLSSREYARLREEFRTDPDLRASRSAKLRGRKLSSEHREKLRIAKLGKKQDPAAVAKRAAANKGKKHKEGTGEKISKALKGKKRTGQALENIRKGTKLAQTNRIQSPEEKEKRAQKLRGQKRSEAFCTQCSIQSLERQRKRRELGLENTYTEENMKVFSTSGKRMAQGNSVEGPQREKFLAAIRSPEVLAKQSENSKKRWSESKTCPYCGVSGKGPNMYRWHFDNCKYKGEEIAPENPDTQGE